MSSHNGLKALAVDDHFGAGATPRGCEPDAEMERVPNRFKVRQ